MTALLEARGVTRVLPGAVPVTLVQGIDLSFGAGEFVSITGPSGSGKSSLLYLLGLLDRPSDGSVLLDGRDTGAMGADDLAALRLARLGFVFQFHFLLPEFTVLGNVMVPMRRLGALPPARQRERAASLLGELGLEGQADKLPEQLSGGQRQRVAIARALANGPAVILADEPTGSLDTANGRIVFDVFERLVDQAGVTVVTVTHDEHLAARTRRRVHLVDGRVVADGPVAGGSVSKGAGQGPPEGA